jgi:hypothetical protein
MYVIREDNGTTSPFSDDDDDAAAAAAAAEIFPGGKGGLCVGLTTLPPSCADCLEIWEAVQASGIALLFTLKRPRSCRGGDELQRYSFVILGPRRGRLFNVTPLALPLGKTQY